MTDSRAGAGIGGRTGVRARLRPVALALSSLLTALAGCGGDPRPDDPQALGEGADPALAVQVNACGRLTTFNYTDGNPINRGYGFYLHPDGTALLVPPGGQPTTVTIDEAHQRMIIAALLRCGFFHLRREYHPLIAVADGDTFAVEAATASGLHQAVFCDNSFPQGMSDFRAFFSWLIRDQGWEWTHGDWRAEYADMQADAAGDLVALSFRNGSAAHPGYRVEFQDPGHCLVTAPDRAPVVVAMTFRRRLAVVRMLMESGFFSTDPDPIRYMSDHNTPDRDACEITAATAAHGSHTVSCLGIFPPAVAELRTKLTAFFASAVAADAGGGR